MKYLVKRNIVTIFRLSYYPGETVLQTRVVPLFLPDGDSFSYGCLRLGLVAEAGMKRAQVEHSIPKALANLLVSLAAAGTDNMVGCFVKVVHGQAHLSHPQIIQIRQKVGLRYFRIGFQYPVNLFLQHDW